MQGNERETVQEKQERAERLEKESSAKLDCLLKKKAAGELNAEQEKLLAKLMADTRTHARQMTDSINNKAGCEKKKTEV